MSTHSLTGAVSIAPETEFAAGFFLGQLIQAWPEEAFASLNLTQATAVVLLTHDPKIDDPALHVVLGSPAFYVGALGSTKTHARRVKRLTKDEIRREIKAACQRKNLSVADLSKKSQVSQRAIQGFLDARDEVSPPVLYRLCEALGLDKRS